MARKVCRCDPRRRAAARSPTERIFPPMAVGGGQSVFDDAIKHFGRADILVNNADPASTRQCQGDRSRMDKVVKGI